MRLLGFFVAWVAVDGVLGADDDYYYRTLEVPRTATSKEIKSAYRKQALRWHPDKNPENREEAERRFRVIAEAYEVLSDDARKRDYDRFGRGASSSSSTSAGGGRRREGHPSGFGGSTHHFRSAEDIFKEFFGDEDPFANLDKVFEGAGFAGAFGDGGRKGRSNKGNPFAGTAFGSMFGTGFNVGQGASFSFSSTTTTTSGGQTVTKTVRSSSGADGHQRRSASVEERIGGRTTRRVERTDDTGEEEEEKKKKKNDPAAKRRRIRDGL